MALDTLILDSWGRADADRGTLWFTVVGRQGPPVVLVQPLDTEPNRRLARPEGAAGQRVASQSGVAMWIRSAGEPPNVRFVLTSGIGTPDARRRVVAEMERLGLFPGHTLKF